MSSLKIPHFGIARQYKNLREELLEATDNALSGGKLMGDYYTRTFEHWLSEKTNTKYAVTVHSGTQALEIIAKFLYNRLSILPATQAPTITIPNLTYPATLNAFLNTGWTIVLGDTNSYGIMEETTTDSACCLVGLYGRSLNRLPTWDIANKATIHHYGSIMVNIHHYGSPPCIIDGAQHWLAAHGEVGIGMSISFDPTKNLSAPGNGGAIVTNQQELYSYASNYRNNACDINFSMVGTNSRMSELDCAHLLVKTKYIDTWQDRRTKIAQHYCDILRDTPINLLNDTLTDSTPHAHQKFVIYSSDRNILHTHLITSGIESKIHYKYTLGELATARMLVKPDMLSSSVMLSRGVLSLPIYPELDDAEVEYVADTVKKWYSTGPYK